MVSHITYMCIILCTIASVLVKGYIGYFTVNPNLICSRDILSVEVNTKLKLLCWRTISIK